MTFDELAGEVPAWYNYAASRLWPAKGPANRPRSWNQCEATANMVVAKVFGMGDWPEPVRAFGSLALPAPFAQLDGHFWGEADVVDRDQAVILDLTVNQTGYPTPWVMGTRAELAASGLYYASSMRTPYTNLTYAL
jgi:hypothetical protein